MYRPPLKTGTMTLTKGLFIKPISYSRSLDADCLVNRIKPHRHLRGKADTRHIISRHSPESLFPLGRDETVSYAQHHLIILAFHGNGKGAFQEHSSLNYYLCRPFLQVRHSPRTQHGYFALCIDYPARFNMLLQ